jgi:hypothetical protein
MQLTLELDIKPLPTPVIYTDHILLTGSCFTEHISDRLVQNKFRALSNPNGILFNPISVADSLNGYMDGKIYGKGDLCCLEEIWHSWDHHTRFSNISEDAAIEGINKSQTEAAEFIRKADWLIITLGSAFQYFLKDSGRPVANNHRAPAQWFEKRLLEIEYINDILGNTLQKLFGMNPYVKVLLTISPVRHIRDGVTENNRSKARLIEAVHTLCDRFEKVYYFPAYELVMDILRDYRFYDIDFVHPNYLATAYVWEQFVKSCIATDAQEVMKQVQDIATARSHRPRFPDTLAHKKFRQAYLAKTKALGLRFPFLDLSDEARFFEEH